jgi:hypothetical protein
MSWSTACRKCVFPFALCPCAGPDAPLGTIAWVSGSLRFAADGEVGASGSDGGVRVPLAAAMVTSGCCWRCASDVVGWNALRAAGVVVSLSPSPAFPPRSIGRGGPESSAGAYADSILLAWTSRDCSLQGWARGWRCQVDLRWWKCSDEPLEREAPAPRNAAECHKENVPSVFIADDLSLSSAL